MTPSLIHVDGALVPWDEATVHLLTPCVKYGALVFEGLRAYWNEAQGQLFVFAAEPHFARFHHTVRAMRFEARYETADLTARVVELLRANEVRSDVHLRVAAYVTGDGLYDATGPISLMAAAYGRASGPLEGKAVSAGVVSWRRIDDASMPPRLKVAANYHNGRLGALEAQANGHDEPIFLTAEGRVAEGAGSCLLIVRDGVLIAPAVTEGILESVTRHTILDLAAKAGIPVSERPVDRTELLFAEEAFFCGTGVEVAPVTRIDHLDVGSGALGPVTRRLWEAYEAVVRGNVEDRAEIRTPVW